jgi:Ca2+-binding RTX toxin-like protein
MAVFTGTPLNDFIVGFNSDDDVLGFEASDTLDGLGGQDSIVGNQGDDLLFGNFGNDTLHGGLDNDSLDGGDESDTLFGDRNDDTLTGGPGGDFLTGGLNNDLFVISPGSGGGSLFEADIITDFGNGLDVIGLAGGLRYRDLNIYQSISPDTGGTVIENNFTGEILAIVQGVTRGNIGPGNFVEIPDVVIV